MNTLPEDDFAELESRLRAMRPRALEAGFAEHVAAESGATDSLAALETRLRALRPVSPSAGLIERVMAESAPARRDNILRFPRWREIAGLAAAVALAVLVVSNSGDKPAPAGALVASATTAPAQAEPGFSQYAVADDGSILPVINLEDGTAMRAVIRPAQVMPQDLRLMPGAVMPASFQAAPARIEYVPVEYN